MINNTSIKNTELTNYPFLDEMYSDEYFPNFLVDKGRDILIKLCETIEAKNPKSLDKLYMLTHVAPEKFNALVEEFEANDSEIETVARDCIGTDFVKISRAYGFDADVE